MLLQRIPAIRNQMSGADRRIADLVLERPFDAATWTIHGLAAQAGVSSATANRFARKLGYAKYVDFRQALFAEMRQVLAPEEKLQSHGGAITPAAIGHRAFVEAGEALAHAAGMVSETVFKEAISLLSAARRVHVLGFGTSNAVARLAGHMLEPLVADIRECATAGGTEDAARRLHSAGPEDVVIAITLPRYSRETVTLAAAAATRGAAIIGLTDTLRSPLATIATIVATVGSEHCYHPGSCIPAMTFIEALTTGLAHHCDRAGERLADISMAMQPYIYSGETRQTANNAKKEEEPNGSTT